MANKKKMICTHCGEYIELTDALYKNIMRQGGSAGGKATKKKYGKNYYSELGKKSALKRWANRGTESQIVEDPKLPA